jgi:uncharacterized membrane protein
MMLLISDLKYGVSSSEIGSLLLALGSLSILPVPLLGIFSLSLGTSLLLPGIRTLSKYYSEMRIFRNLSLGFALWIVSLLIEISSLSVLQPLSLLIFSLLLLLITVIHFEANKSGYWSTDYVADTLSEYVDYVLTIFFTVLLLPLFYLAFLLMLSPRGAASTIALILSSLIVVASIIFSMTLRNPLYKLSFFMGVLTIAITLCFSMAGLSPDFRIISLILAIVASLTLPLLGALCFNDAFGLLAVKTGKKSFRFTGSLLALGVIELSILNVIGTLIVMPIAWIIASLSFLRLEGVKMRT